MKRKLLRFLTIALFGSIMMTPLVSCSDDDEDVNYSESDLNLDEYFSRKVQGITTEEGYGNVLDDLKNAIKELSGGNSEEEIEARKDLEERLARYEAYCEHKSDSVKEANPEGFQHALDSLKALDPENSLMSGIGQMFGTYGWTTLTYPDLGADGKYRAMSTLVIWPCNVFKSLDASHVIFCPHWTIAKDEERPTNFQEPGAFSYESSNANVMAGEWAAFAEYLIVMPDYEGYGASKNVSHPYLNREVQARQCITAINIAIGWFTSDDNVWDVPGGHDKKLKKNWKLVAEGYSQGGAVAGGTYRFWLEHKNEDWAKKLPFAGAVCGDGPHDPLATLRYYCRENYVDMPVAPALMLKGMCDSDPDMIANKITPADYCNPGFIKSGIFEAIASKNYTTDDCSDFVYKYAKEHPDEIKLDENGELPADQMLNEAAYNFFLNGKIIKGASVQKLQLLRRCLEKNQLFYNFTPPAGACFTFFHSKSDKVVPYDNYLSVLNAWGDDKLYGVTYDGKEKSHNGVGEAFIKHHHNHLVDKIIDGDWEPGTKTQD